MAFSVVASSSLLSSRVSTPLKKQNKRNSRNSHAFSCKAMSDAEIDAKYPVGGSVYKVKSFWTFPVFPLSCSVVTIHHRQNQCLLLILTMKETKKKLFAFSNWSFFLPYADDEAEIRENLFSPLCFLFIQKIKLKTKTKHIFFLRTHQSNYYRLFWTALSRTSRSVYCWNQGRTADRWWKPFALGAKRSAKCRWAIPS